MAGIVVSTDAGGRAEVRGVGVSSLPPRVRNVGNLTANGDSVILAVDGYSALALQLSTGWTGTIAVLGSMDDGATYPITVAMLPWAGGVSVSAFAAGGNWECAVGALTHVKVAAQTAISGGPAAALLAATIGLKSIRVGTPAANPLPVLDGGNASFTSSAALTIGEAAVAAGRSLRVYATAAGMIQFKTSAGNTVSRYFNAGENEFAFAVIQVMAVYAADGASIFSGTITIENEA